MDELEVPSPLGHSRLEKATLLGCLAAAWILANIDRLAMTLSIVPMSKEFGLGPRAVGFVLSSFYVTYALMNLGAGWLSNKFGARFVLVFCVVSWSVFTMLTGLAWSLPALLVIRGLFGVGEGCFSPASSVAITEVFAKDERARAKALLLGAAAVAAVGTGPVAALIHALGWRTTYQLLGGLGLLMAVTLWAATKPISAGVSGPKVKNDVGIIQLMRTPLLARTTSIMFLSSTLIVGFGAWFPSYLSKTRHLGLVMIGTGISISAAVGLVSLLLTGWMLDKFGSGRERAILRIATMGLVVGTILTVLSNSTILLFTFWTCTAIAGAMILATVYAIPLKYMPHAAVGTAAGVINFGVQAAGAIAPASIGLLVGQFHGSFTPALWMLIISGVAACVVSATWNHSEDHLSMFDPSDGVPASRLGPAERK